MIRPCGVLLALLLLPAVAAAEHVDARDYPAPGAGREAFARMERALERGFDYICGDTFCEGDYGNLRALQLRCAVRRRDATVSGCTWSFAGSYAYVDGDTAVPQVDARRWACALPVPAGTPLKTLLARLSAPEGFETPLPGSELSTYDALTLCL